MSSRRGMAALAALRERAGRAVASTTIVALVLTSAGGLLTPPAFAGDLPKVLVLPYAPIYDSLPASVGEKTADLLSNELKSSEQLQLVQLKAEAAPVVTKQINPTPRRDSGLLAEAKEHANKADELIKKLKFKPAADELEKAIALFEGQHAYVDFGELTSAYLSLAVAYFRLSQDSDGERMLSQVIRLEPDRKLDAERFPPVFLRIFDNLGGKLRGAPRGSIQVTGASGATVFLDGRELGKSPLQINDVIKGRHFLAVVPASGDVWADRIEVRPNDTAKVSPDLGGGGGPGGELAALLSRNALDEVAVSKALSLADSAKADFVVLGGVHKEGDTIVVSSHLLNTSNRKLCLLQRVVFDQEMLGAGIEVYKVGADVANRVDIFGDEERIPTKVARDALPRPGSSSSAIASVSAGSSSESGGRRPAGGGGRAPVSSNSGSSRSSSSSSSSSSSYGGSSDGETRAPASGSERVVSRRGGDAPRVVETAPRSEVRNVIAQPGDLNGEPTGPNESELPALKKGSSNTALWIALGIVAVGAVGAGGFFGYSYMTRPVTGTATINW